MLSNGFLYNTPYWLAISSCWLISSDISRLLFYWVFLSSNSDFGIMWSHITCLCLYLTNFCVVGFRAYTTSSGSESLHGWAYAKWLLYFIRTCWRSFCSTFPGLHHRYLFTFKKHCVQWNIWRLHLALHRFLYLLVSSLRLDFL